MTETLVAWDEHALVASLRRGDETAFRALIDSHSAAMLRVAMAYVPSRAVAEEVVQEAWLGVLRGLDRFECRSSLKTWIFRILTNIAITRGSRESRGVPFSALAAAEDHDGPSVDPDRFFGPGHPQYPGHWALAPTAWETPEERLLSGETRDIVLAAIAALPVTQRTVIALRDIEGWPADEVCGALAVSEVNQRVLLHRARTKVRLALERQFAAIEPTLPVESAGV